VRDANFAGAFLESRIIADSLIELFRTVTAYPEVIPKKCGSVRVGDKPTGRLLDAFAVDFLWTNHYQRTTLAKLVIRWNATR
jgi:hypothetical protein